MNFADAVKSNLQQSETSSETSGTPENTETPEKLEDMTPNDELSWAEISSNASNASTDGNTSDDGSIIPDIPDKVDMSAYKEALTNAENAKQIITMMETEINNMENELAELTKQISLRKAALCTEKTKYNDAVHCSTVERTKIAKILLPVPTPISPPVSNNKPKQEITKGTYLPKKTFLHKKQQKTPSKRFVLLYKYNNNKVWIKVVYIRGNGDFVSRAEFTNEQFKKFNDIYCDAEYEKYGNNERSSSCKYISIGDKLFVAYFNGIGLTDNKYFQVGNTKNIINSKELHRIIETINKTNDSFSEYY